MGVPFNLNLANRSWNQHWFVLSSSNKARQKSPKDPSCTQRGQLFCPAIQTTITRQRGQACYLTIWKKEQVFESRKVPGRRLSSPPCWWAYVMFHCLSVLMLNHFCNRYFHTLHQVQELSCKLLCRVIVWLSLNLYFRQVNYISTIFCMCEFVRHW